MLGPYLPLARHLGRIAVGLCDLGTTGLEVVYSGGLSEYDTRLLTAGVVEGALSARSDEPVNLVNAGPLAASRGIAVHESRSGGKDKGGKQFTRSYVWVDTWMERNGKWQCISEGVMESRKKK